MGDKPTKQQKKCLYCLDKSAISSGCTQMEVFSNFLLPEKIYNKT